VAAIFVIQTEQRGVKVFYIDEKFTMIYVAPGPFAIGTGGHAAMGALLAGASAAKAVAIASQVDAHTGGGIDEVRFG
jgi:hypothetical protein